MAIHTATGEASRVYSISIQITDYSSRVVFGTMYRTTACFNYRQESLSATDLLHCCHLEQKLGHLMSTEEAEKVILKIIFTATAIGFMPVSTRLKAVHQTIRR